MAKFCRKCGHKNKDNLTLCEQCREGLLSPDSILEPGLLLDGRYEIVHKIKSGGMGAVYKALDCRFDRRPCAVKEMVAPYSSTEEQEYFITRFKKEAQILHELRHSNLPVVKDYFIENGRYYLVMDYIEGRDLQSIIQFYGDNGVPEKIVMAWAKAILDALHYLHSQNPPIIYRDLKPGNIIFQFSTERVILVDFGIARPVNPETVSTVTVVGTPVFAPEELFKGKIYTGSDIYSLGATMHCLLTGVIPSAPLSFKPLRSIKPHISKKLEAIVMRALSRDVKDRYESAKAMKKELEKLSSSTEKLTMPPELYLETNTEEEALCSGEGTETYFPPGGEATVPVEDYVSEDFIELEEPYEERSSRFLEALENKKIKYGIISFIILALLVFLWFIVPFGFYMKGNKELRKGNYEEACTYYDKACERFPGFAGIHYNHGMACYYLGRFDEAKKWFDKATVIKEDRPEGWFWKGKTLLKLEKEEEAFSCFEEIMKLLENNSSEEWFWKGKIFFIRGNFEKAEECFEEAVNGDAKYSGLIDKFRHLQEEEEQNFEEKVENRM